MRITHEGRRGKYGVVTVLNQDRTINRQYRITGEELATLHASGNGIPPGCTRNEWTSGMANVAGHDLDTGEVQVHSNGSLLLKYAESEANSRFVASFVLFRPGEWSGTVPDITVPASVLEGIEGMPIESITDGELTVRP